MILSILKNKLRILRAQGLENGWNLWARAFASRIDLLMTQKICERCLQARTWRKSHRTEASQLGTCYIVACLRTAAKSTGLRHQLASFPGMPFLQRHGIASSQHGKVGQAL